MSTFGEDLIQSLNEALAHAKGGSGPGCPHNHVPYPRPAAARSLTLPPSDGLRRLKSLARTGSVGRREYHFPPLLV